jgi:hypothetical protein
MSCYVWCLFMDNIYEYINIYTYNNLFEHFASTVSDSINYLYVGACIFQWIHDIDLSDTS